MRLWTLHPKYLDARGLVALWRESLLAQAVLRGQTRGYISHPQLIRFRETASPLASVARYLQVIQAEAMARGYHFDAGKIGAVMDAEPMVATRGQLDYEWACLKKKLKTRAPSNVTGLARIACPEPHPLFRIVPGPVADWEIAGRKARRTRGAGK